MDIKYDDSKINIEEIKAAVKKAGYEVIDENKNKAIDLKIGGMTCAACAKAIERSTKKLDGVSLSNVNIATEKAHIEYDASKVKYSQIKAAIEKSGYSILEEKKESKVDEDKIRKEKEIKSLLVKFLVSIGFSIPLHYISMRPNRIFNTIALYSNGAYDAKTFWSTSSS